MTTHHQVIEYIRLDGKKGIARVEIIVDQGQIARELGPKATRNKAKRTRYLFGAVIVNVLEERLA